MNEQLKDELLKKAVDKKISCAAAQKLAENHGVPYLEVGVLADELGIKIKDCQLGCF